MKPKYTFNKVSWSELSRSDIGAHLYSDELLSAKMTYLGKIIDLEEVEASDGRDNWSKCGVTVYLDNGTSQTVHANSTRTYYMLRYIDAEPKTEPVKTQPPSDLAFLRSYAIHAASKVVAARMDADLRPENPNADAAIELAEDGFDAAVQSFAAALSTPASL